MVGKLMARTEDYALAYEHPGCHRTSNQVDRLMNRLHHLSVESRSEPGASLFATSEWLMVMFRAA